MPHARLYRIAAGCLVLLTLVLSKAVIADSGEEILVSDPAFLVNDEEFDQQNAQFTWEDQAGNLWLGRVDPQTGDFLPNSGQSLLLDTGVVPIGQNRLGNGPEWALGTSSQIAYTKYNSTGQTALTVASFDGTSWASTLLANSSNRLGPIGSKDPADPAPRILYAGTNRNGQPVAMWREIARPATERVIPGLSPPGGSWVAGERAVVYPRKSKGTQQIYEFFIDTATTVQVSSDDGNKSTPFMWRAPEFDNDYVCFAIVDGTAIGVYRNVGGNWQRINTLKPPSPRDYLSSAENFIYNGRSYIFMLTSDSPNPQEATAPTDVWIAGIDPELPFYRQVSDQSVKVRRDPEVFIAASGPFIYFLEPVGYQKAIFRADTGLGSP